MYSLISKVGLVLGCGLLAVAVSAAELVSNGGFETNGGAGSATFSNWTVVRENATAGVDGNFYVQTGTPLAHCKTHRKRHTRRDIFRDG